MKKIIDYIIKAIRFIAQKGRFMMANVIENGKFDLNFNRAYNPPCNYTPYATCPVPPPNANWLKVRIEAGEKTYPDRGTH